MRKQTDLDEVKRTAITLLHTDIYETPYSPMIVKHPFADTGLTALPDGNGGITMINLIDAIIGEDKSRHTRDNAFLSRKAVDESGIDIKTALIVCKAFHARRCLMLYQMAFPNVEIKVCPVHCYNITKDNWFTTENGIDRVLGELARCGNQFVGDMKSYLSSITNN